MSKEKRRVPKLRFPGFTEDWEQYKLSDITEVIMGQSPSSKNYTDNPNDDILVQGNADLKDGKVVPRLWTKEITKTIDKGGIILTVRAPVGDVAKTDYKVVLGRGVAGIKGNDYIYQFLQKLQYNRYWVSLSSGSTFESINSNDIKDLIIDIPSIEEQTKISMLLNNVNSIITLHQRKLEQLNLKKKALLQKLFPKNGECYPELRFPGFTDAWEQRKLSEIVTINPKTELPDEFKYVDLESVVGTNLLGFQVIKKENAPSRAQRLASYGDVFYQTVRPYQRNNYLFENVDKDMVFSTGYAQLRSKLDSYFLLTLVQNNNFVKVVLDNCTGTSYPAINRSELGKIIVQIPSNEVEANQIGKVFRGIDKSITLHQRKLDHLQLQKKALLQQMFV